MLYLKPLNKLQKILQKLKLRLGVFLAILLGVILCSWVSFSQQPVTLNLLMTAPDAQPWRQGMIKDFEAKTQEFALT